MRFTFQTAKTAKTTDKKISQGKVNELVHAVKSTDGYLFEADAIAICGYKTKKYSTWRPTVEKLTCPKCQKKLHYVLDDVKFWEIGRKNKENNHELDRPRL